MAEKQTKSPAEAFFANAGQWKAEFTRLRAVALASGLAETLKWGKPCYTLDGGNIVLIHGFKEYCALLFFKGALLRDPRGLLVRQTENVLEARQIRFTGTEQIAVLEPTLKDYIQNAVAVERAGLRAPAPAPAALTLPQELERRFVEEPALKAAFDALTPGRRRGYTLYFSKPRQGKTREARIEKCAARILSGKGLTDPS